MDQQAFDNLSRSVARSVSRRGIFHVIGAALTVGVLGLRSSEKVGAQADVFAGGLSGVPLGSACTDRTECSQQLPCLGIGSVVCADNGIPEDGALNCCVYEGGTCTSDAGCCAGLLCYGGGGEGCGAGGCHPVGWTGDRGLGPCTTNEECSQDQGPSRCAPNASSGETSCCRDVGALCAQSGSCCGSLVCSNGVCGEIGSGETRAALTDLNLRSEPNLGGAVLLVIPAGGVVTLTGEVTETGWVAVDYAATSGWVAVNLLG